MRGINKATILGTLGKDPEVRYTPAGAAVTTLSLATSDQWKDKQTGEKREATEWHRVVMFGRLAEIAGEYLVKGSIIHVEGPIQTRKWQDQNGNDKYTTEIKALEMVMVGGKSKRDQEGGGNQAPAAAPAQAAAPSQGPTDDFDDDISF